MSRMTAGDARLVAMLTVLRDRLGPVVDEISFGELSTADRRGLARALRRVADLLDGDAVVLVEVEHSSTGRSDVA